MRSNNPSRGFTMVEMVISMSVASVLLVVTVAWIHQSLKLTSIVKQRQRNHTNLTRLAREIRDEVRDSESVSMVGDNQLVLNASGRNITYTISKASVIVEKRNENPNAKPALARDAFVLSPNSIVRWETSELPDWISLVVYRGREGLPSPGSIAVPDSSESQPVNEELLPVDLHIRVAPNRWEIETADQRSAAADEEGIE